MSVPTAPDVTLDEAKPDARPAKRWRDAASFDRESTLVAMKASGTGRPLFLMHPPSGVPWIYVPLLETSRMARPVYVARAADLSTGHDEVLGTRGMVERYLADIRRVQPEGPYSLGGYSFGGYLAFEIAERLLRAGEGVEHLVLLDVPAPAAGARWWRMLARRARYDLLRRAFHAGPAGRLALGWCGLASPLELLQVFFRSPAPLSSADLRTFIAVAFPVRAAAGDLRGLTFDELCDVLVDEFRKVAPPGQWDRERRRATSQTSAALVKAFKVWAKNDWLALKYTTPSVLPLTITVYASSAYGRVAGEWQRYTSRPLVLREVPAAPLGGRNVHLSFLDRANVLLFAQDFRRLFEPSGPDDARPEAAAVSGNDRDESA